MYLCYNYVCVTPMQAMHATDTYSLYTLVESVSKCDERGYNYVSLVQDVVIVEIMQMRSRLVCTFKNQDLKNRMQRLMIYYSFIQLSLLNLKVVDFF